MAVGTYKTLRKIGGVDYITLKEHEEIVMSFTELMTAVDSLRETVGSLSNPINTLVTNLKKTEGISRKS